jgi:hypothetical protein
MTGQPHEDLCPSKEFHRKKTDFSEYTEVSVRFMRGLITEKNKGK